GGDDPLIDPNCILSLVKQHKAHSANFIYASHRKGWIYGTAAELIEFGALEKAHRLATSSVDKEHIVTFIKNNSLFTEIKIAPLNKKEIRDDIFLSVDYREDLDLIEQILVWFSSQNKLYTFGQRDLIALYDSGTLDIRNRDLHQGFSD
ncbi:MAG TPA: hypothetical protein VNX68_03275, partial [Nitrosopumilaceae archaeon]|nr:hypothetical protein [Nitrosopumilaceae archaeon]